MTKFDFSLVNIMFLCVVLVFGMLESLVIIAVTSFNIRIMITALVLWNAFIVYAIFRNLKGGWLKW